MDFESIKADARRNGTPIREWLMPGRTTSLSFRLASSSLTAWRRRDDPGAICTRSGTQDARYRRQAKAGARSRYFIDARRANLDDVVSPICLEADF
jgi:hypothetical protein